MSATPWLAYHRPNPRAWLRLFCFPFAGGAASAYRTWSTGLPETIEVCPVQLPGREARLREPLLHDMPDLVAALAAGLQQHLDLPYALFGHSMGARIAFEFARARRRAGHDEPRHLFASAARPPQGPARAIVRHRLDDEQFKQQMRQLGGTPEAVLQDQALMQIFLPILRADFTLHETYRYQPEPLLDCGITVLSGQQDQEVPLADQQGWRDETRGEFASHQLPGGHLFLQTSQPALLRIVADTLASL